MKNRIFLLLLFLLPLQVVNAQSKNDNQQKYLRAKNLYKQEQWTQAMEAFRELSTIQRNNAFAEYSSFYYALSALNAGRPAEAKAMLQQIRKKYAGWDQQEEVNYWLAQVYMEEKDYRQALQIMQEISDRRVKADAQEMAAAFFAREKDIDLLKDLLQEFPKSDFLAQVVAAKLSRQSLSEQDREYLAQLVRKYKLDQELLKQVEVGPSQRKDAYEVAAMLPFLFDNLSPEASLHERYFVLDLYEGMKIAQKELLNNHNIRINLHAFDTKRDSLTTLNLLSSPVMKDIDLIVGPLYPGPSKVAFDFSVGQGINMVNPLSVNPEVIENNPYSFLFKPSLITQGQKAAEFAAKTFDNKSSVIIYGPKERDSIMAYSYKQTIEKAGFQVKKMIKVPVGEEIQIKQLLQPREGEADALKEGGRLHKTNLGHVFVASEDELIVANTLTAIMSRGDKLPLIGQEAWLRKNFVSFEQLERMGVYFVAPDYIDYASETFKDFRKQYIQDVHNLPSRFAYIGYDLMMFFGRTMNQYGNLFQKEMDQETYYKGLLCTGFSYAKSNDNQCVPVVQFQNSALEIVYQ